VLLLPGRGAARDYEGKKVVSIQYEPARQPIDESELAAAVVVKKGQALRMRDVQASIQRLFATGCYEDVQVDASAVGDGVALRFLTRLAWFIGEVKVTGKIKAPPNAGQAAGATRLELGDRFSQDDVKTGVERIQTLLKQNGYFEAQVEPKIEYDKAEQETDLVFEVTTGKRARYQAPEIKGDLKMDPARIAAATKWKGWFGWKAITQSRTQGGLTGIRRAYRKQDRLMATVQPVNPEAGARPVVTVNAGPKVIIRVTGAKLSGDNRQRYIPIYEEGAVDSDLLAEGVRNLRDYFQSRGYFDVKVAFEQQPGEKDTEILNYSVDLGVPHKLVRIDIRGNHYFDTETIRERMFLAKSSFPSLRHGRFSEAYLRSDLQAITELYRANGFQSVAVTSTRADDYLGRKGHVAVTININEGQQWLVSGLEVAGIEHLDKAQIAASLSSVAGQPYSESNVSLDRDYILELYFASGYRDATFSWASKPGPKPNQMDLQFTIKEGRQQFVRSVIVGGYNETSQELVERNVRIHAGDPLSLEAMADTQRRLYALGIFSEVDMAVQNPQGDTEKKTVVYELAEAHKYFLTGGVGAEIAQIGGSETSLTAPAGQTGFSPRVSFDISRLNLFGLGHTISLRTRLSTLADVALVDYEWPRFRSVDSLTLSFTGGYTDSRDVRTFTSKREEGSAQLTEKLSRADTIRCLFSYRHVTVGDLKISQLLVPLLSQPVRVGMLSMVFIGDRRDDPLDAHRGIYNTVDFGAAYRGFGSQIDFTRFLGRNATYHPLGKRWVFARNLQFGWLQSFDVKGKPADPSQDIPFAERFFGGGDTSMRGFPDFQAGPRDIGTGFPLGGKALLFHQSELRFPLVGQSVGGVLFHDMGNVYSTLGDISFRFHQRNYQDFNYMVHSVGFGIRYRTPVGPVRADLGYGLNPPRFVGLTGTLQELVFNSANLTPVKTGISRIQFFFSIGQTF